MKMRKCAFHTNQNLVNFCRSPQCLLPMCPSCVKIHSAEHVRLNTHGIYDCVSDMHSQVQSTLQYTMKQLIGQGNQLKDILKNRQTEKSTFVEKLKDMRQKILQSINKYIDGLEKEVMSQISSLQSITAQQLQQIDGRIQKISCEAQQETRSLNSQKEIKTIINHISSNMQGHYNYHLNEISSKIKQLKGTQYNLQKQFKPFELNETLRLIGQSYQLTFLQPIKRRQSKKLTLADSNVSKISSTKDCSTNFGSHKRVL